MRRLAIAMTPIALTACALIDDQVRNDAWRTTAQLQDSELCYQAIIAKGGDIYREAVQQTLRSRNVDCNRHAALIMARVQSDASISTDQARRAALLLQAARPQPIPGPPPQVNCRTFRVGTEIQTICN